MRKVLEKILIVIGAIVAVFGALLTVSIILATKEVIDTENLHWEYVCDD